MKNLFSKLAHGFLGLVLVSAFVNGPVAINIAHATAPLPVAETPLICDSNLVAYYPLTANADDSGPNGLDGSEIGSPTYTSGMFGTNALTLNGSSQYVTLPNALWESYIAGQNELSITAWVKTDQVTTSNQFTVLSGAHTSGISPAAGVLAGWHGNSPQFLRFEKRTANDDDYDVNETADSYWHHVAFVDDGSELHIYLDGSEVGSGFSSTDDWTSFQNSTQLMAIGQIMANGNSPAANWYSDGQMQDLAIFNRALSSTEVGDLYSGSWPTSVPLSQTQFKCDANLVAYYPLSSNVNDSGSHGLNGTAINSPTYTTGKFGTNALTLDGSSQYVTLPNSLWESYIAGQNKLTVSAWVKPDQVNAGNQFTILCGVRTSGISPAGGILAGWHGDSPQFLRFEKRSTSDDDYDVNETLDSNWHHVVFVGDGTSLHTYFDGVEVGTPMSSTSNWTSFQNSTQLLAIGQIMANGNSPVGNWYADGKIQDLAIFNRALSASEVSALYSFGN